MRNLIAQKSSFLNALAWIFLAAAALIAGCAGSPGRTVQEIDRRHINTIRTNWIQMQDDLDAALMLDRPSRLSEMYVR